MINEIFVCFFSGFFIGIRGIFGALSLYLGLNDLIKQIIAYIIGIPAIVISSFLIVRNIVKICFLRK